jgi:hypothetical protein
MQKYTQRATKTGCTLWGIDMPYNEKTESASSSGRRLLWMKVSMFAARESPQLSQIAPTVEFRS